MTMHNALHPRDDIDRLYVSRRERRRGLTNIENSVDTSIQRLEDYIQKSGGRLITATRNNSNDTTTSGTTKTRKWEENTSMDVLKRLTSDILHEKMLTWLRKANWISFNSSTKQRHIKARIDKTQRNNICRLCGERGEIINHISEWSKLSQKEYKTSHDSVGKVIHWELCKNFKFEHTNKWYTHNS